MLRWEHDLAARTHAFLLPVKRMSVRPVVGQFTQVRALGDVLAMVDLMKQFPYISPQALVH